MTTNDTWPILALFFGVALVWTWGALLIASPMSPAGRLIDAPPGYELECVDNPGQAMVCKAYCGSDYPRPERPHP